MKQIVITSISSVVAAILVCLVMLSNSKDKVVFIDTVKVYNEFDLKQELESKLKRQDADRRVVVDSLKLELNELYGRSENPEGELLSKIQTTQYQLEHTEGKVNQLYQATANKYSEEILTQLNQYLKDFGEASDFELIVGANAQGTVIYGSEGKDVTQEAIEYVNKRYSE